MVMAKNSKIQNMAQKSRQQTVQPKDGVDVECERNRIQMSPI